MKVHSGMGSMSAPPAAPEQGLSRPSGRFRVPALPTTLVERRGLLDVLSDAVDSAPLTLVCAPAGSGKTVLVSHWARSGVPALAWMSASERDSDPRTFWWHVRSALAEGGAVQVGAKREVFPMAGAADEADLLADQLLGSGTTVVLVVDAADRLGGREVFDGLAALVDGAAGLLRVVLTTRNEPPMPLHRYRLEGTVAEVGRDDLALTSAELATLLELHDLDSGDETVRDVLSRTEGWAAGARMAALAMRPDGGGSTLEQLAADYLAAEVLDFLPQGDEHVLLHVGVVEEVSPDLAVALSGQRDAEERLRDLTRRNAFVEVVPDRPGHHRVHPLLRDLLAGRRQAAADGRDEELHRIACDWFGGERQLAPAVEHAVTAGDWERAASWTLRLDGAVDLLLATSAGAALADRLRGMPDAGRPQVSLVRAALALADHDLDKAREHLARVDRMVEQQADAQSAHRSAGDDQAGDRTADGPELDDHLQMWAAVLAARLGELSGDDGAVLAAADRALSMPAMNTSGAPDVAAQTALVRCSQGTAYAHAGRLQDASVALEDGAAAGVMAARDPLTLRCMSMLALAEACQGRLTHAQEVADAAEQVAERITRQATEHSGATARPAALDLAHAWVALDRQDLPRAGHALNKAVQGGDPTEPPLLQWISLLLRVRLKRDHGDGVSARRLIQGVDGQVGWLRSAFDEEASAVGLLASVADLRTSSGANPAGMDGQTALTADTHHVAEMLESARIDWLRGDRRASRSTVAAALARAQGERLRRPFTHASPEIRAMLRDDAELRSQANWLRPDHATGPDHRHRRRDRAPVVEDLSERELEVLRHLSDLLTTEEIAAEMFISANTVRTHIRRILAKLSVSRRHEAVRRARELNLV